MKRVSDSGTTGCTVPLHDVVAVGTLAGLLKQAGLTNEEFLNKYFK